MRRTLGTHATFFKGEVALSNGIYYLQFPKGNVFGYYAYLSDPHYVYHFDLGYEYVFDANDGQGGAYFYDFYSRRWWYTSPQFAFPYLYDFSDAAFLYYYADTSQPGHYTSYPRYFYNFGAQHIAILPMEVPDWTFTEAQAGYSPTGPGAGVSFSVGPSQGVTWSGAWDSNNSTGPATLISWISVNPNDTQPATFFTLVNGAHVVAYLKLFGEPTVPFSHYPTQTITVDAPSTFGGTQCSLYSMQVNGIGSGLVWQPLPGQFAPSGNTLSIPASDTPLVIQSAGFGGPTFFAIACVTPPPGAFTLAWAGNGGFATSASPVTVTPMPGSGTQPTASSAPMAFASVGQSATVSLSQANYSGPFSYQFGSTKTCAGNVEVSHPSAATFVISDLANSFSNCVVYFYAAPGDFTGPSISIPVNGPVSLGGTVN